MPDFSGSAFGKIAASKARSFYLPGKIEIPVKDLKWIDLLDLELPDMMVRGLRFKRSNYSSFARNARMPYKRFMNFVYRDSMPKDILGKLSLRLPDGVLVGLRRDRISLPRKIAVNEDLLFLLGFYLAEGHARKKDRLNYQVSFASASKNVRSYVAGKIKSVFGISPATDSKSVTICSHLVYELFVNRLSLGKGAYSKKIPDFVFSLSPRKISALMRGYFLGDGSVSLGSTLEVSCTSVSKLLLEGLGFLLARFGIRHAIVKSERYIKSRQIIAFYGKAKRLVSYKLRIYGESSESFISSVGFALGKGEKAERLLKKWRLTKRAGRSVSIGGLGVEPVADVEIIRNGKPFVYSITVEPSHNLLCSGVMAYQCDGDEDTIMLLLDPLINFSKRFLPDSHGGTMDAPLILLTVINPKEIDDEAHCIETCQSYGYAFYEKGDAYSSPSDARLPLIKDLLGRPEQYDGMWFTHDTANIEDGVLETAYVKFESMADKVGAQFAIQDKVRAVDSRDVAQRIINSHFFPDIYGNLRSYSRQIFRCVDCGRKFRRVPLAGKCLACGGKLLLTINKGGIEKYIELTKKLANDYSLPPYVKQRVSLLESDLKSLFDDDKVKQVSLADYI